MAEPSSYQDQEKFQTLNEKYQELKKQLDRAMSKWEKLASQEEKEFNTSFHTKEFTPYCTVSTLIDWE